MIAYMPWHSTLNKEEEKQLACHYALRYNMPFFRGQTASPLLGFLVADLTWLRMQYYKYGSAHLAPHRFPHEWQFYKVQLRRGHET